MKNFKINMPTVIAAVLLSMLLGSGALYAVTYPMANAFMDSSATGDIPVQNASGWFTGTDPATISSLPAGANKQIQYNDNGAFGAEASFEYDSAINELTVDQIATATACNAGTSMSAGTAMAAGTSMVANTHIESTTSYVKAGTDFRLISSTANSGGGYKQLLVEATTGAMSGATEVVTLNIPEDAKLIGVQVRVDTLVEGAAAIQVLYSGGATQLIAAAMPVAKNTKVDIFFDENADTAITTGAATNVTLNQIGGNFTAGVVRVIVYYEDLIAMDNNP